jgi:arginine deiminase
VPLRDAIAAAEPTGAPRSGALDARVDSEVGRLRSVLVHRPGDELQAVNRANAERMLFTEPVDIEQARAQHDAFVATLRAHRVEVVYLEQLLAELAADQRRRDALLDAVLPDAPASVRHRLALLEASRIARALVAGMRERELPLSGTGGAWLLQPLPNLLFTRDPSAWIGRGAIIGAMATSVRRRESTLLDALYRLHPRFAGASASPGVEGGDVLVAGQGRIVLGISPRTTARGAHRLASALLLRRVATEVLTIEVPRGAGFHLDLVLGMVDRDTFAVWAPVRRALRAHRWQPTTSGVSVCAVADPFSWLSRSSRVIDIGSVKAEAHGRAWDHGINLLALAPGVVIAYADNDRANAQLAAAGVEVIALPGAALASGRGGPRCLSCPLNRDADD